MIGKACVSLISDALQCSIWVKQLPFSMDFIKFQVDGEMKIDSIDANDINCNKRGLWDQMHIVK